MIFLLFAVSNLRNALFARGFSASKLLISIRNLANFGGKGTDF
ncbi:hypothetical protein C943_02651 [Mariniradius saccharolyticus AK6]|uniref:Uncharacterized protein n=1 Tax=Mariniradius saccharolyticus AK6 TaxID=1239962 RepID=M7X8N1_9BACT|nr:hypothetical protein C943_02651 [Mariniradius saccharolyticus AK6]